MRSAHRASIGVVTAAAFLALSTIAAAGQATGRNPGSPPTATANARPDLQGIWSFASVTPLERPKALADKEVLTAEERAKIEEEFRARLVDRPPRPGSVGAYNQFWFEWGTKTVATGRTSLIVDPQDGRLPPLTDQGKQRLATRSKAAESPADPEAAWPWERCLLGFNGGPPINGGEYNAYVQIVQTAEYVVVHTEMVHDARIVSLSGTVPQFSHLRQWRGFSSGRWEGDTLVIETKNFRPEGTGVLYLQERGLGFTDENLHLVERFRRTNEDTLLYEFTLDDPTVWTRPWTVSMTMERSDLPMYEYACHEGNIGLKSMLTGARADERRAAEKPAGDVR